MANYDITSQLQEFLTNNTPGGYSLSGQLPSGYYQTDPPSSSTIPNADAIRAILNQEHILRESSEIKYNQLNADTKDQLYTDIQRKLSTLATTGKYKDLLRHPVFPDGYNTWLISDVADPPAFQKVAFTGEYDDLKHIPDLNGYATLTSLATVAKTGKFSDLKFDDGDPSITVDTDAIASAVEAKISLQNLDGYDEFKENILSDIAIDAVDTVFIHNILGESALSDLTDGTYDTTLKIASDSQYSINDLLNELIKEFSVAGVFKETIIKLITNWGTCLLLGIEFKNNIYKFNFSFIDAFTEKNLDYLHNNNNVTSTTKLNNISGKFFYPTFYYNIDENELLVKRNYITLLSDLSKTALTGNYNDLKNKPDINAITFFDVRNSLDSTLKNFTDGKIDTTQKLTSESSSPTIDTWLNNIITLYNNNDNTKNIKIKNNITDLNLNSINVKNNIYFFTFSPLVESNYNNMEIFSDSDEVLNNLNIKNYLIYFIYDKSNNTLWIKRIEK